MNKSIKIYALLSCTLYSSYLYASYASLEIDDDFFGNVKNYEGEYKYIGANHKLNIPIAYQDDTSINIATTSTRATGTNPEKPRENPSSSERKNSGKEKTIRSPAKK